MFLKNSFVHQIIQKIIEPVKKVKGKDEHKDLKLADHYSKSTEDDQKHFSEKIMEHIRRLKQTNTPELDFENVVSLKRVRNGTID